MKTIRKISSVEAAYQILKREKRAMTSREIIEMAFKEFDMAMKGKTPDATLTSNFINEIERRNNAKREQRFIRVSPGKWGLVEYLNIYYKIK